MNEEFKPTTGPCLSFIAVKKFFENQGQKLDWEKVLDEIESGKFFEDNKDTFEPWIVDGQIVGIRGI